MWLHDRPAGTARAYDADVRAFLQSANCGLRDVTLGHVQAYADTLRDFAPASRARRLSSVKSLLTFAHTLGYLPFNVGAPVRLPKVENRLAERIVDGDDLARLLVLETNPRNAAILTLLYRAGLRISEVAGLCWRHIQSRQDGGQIAIHGKGGKTRFVKIGPKLMAKLEALRPADAVPDGAVFVSREGGHMDPASVHRVVKKAADRAGLPAHFSAHWLRHAHASHALDNGAPVHLVASTL
ncbi:MAG: tyrosine-type recombinase/integrase [Proteobacteria bacterium]|nr:tyrosine-type recombinase/integrase [Pseudomonadota bacterium]